jgi:hypothetical protein
MLDAGDADADANAEADAEDAAATSGVGRSGPEWYPIPSSKAR